MVSFWDFVVSEDVVVLVLFEVVDLVDDDDGGGSSTGSVGLIKFSIVGVLDNAWGREGLLVDLRLELYVNSPKGSTTSVVCNIGVGVETDCFIGIDSNCPHLPAWTLVYVFVVYVDSLVFLPLF